jgi:hypothetical protein|nr:MAG TPA: hypothetical protein [Caudoviricetes sp.]
MEQSGKPPKKNSSEWRKNESIIAKHPGLRAARDISEGFTPGKSVGTGGWTPTEAYKNNYDLIFGKKNKEDDVK